MASLKYIKAAVLGAFAFLFLFWMVSGTLLKVIGTDGSDQTASSDALPTPTPDPNNYVGSETCQACHEAQFKDFSATKHGKLGDLSSWKGKVQGCESCHGPGKEHVEGGGDITKIISFKNKNAKVISETCLTCHAGKESHNNFRRGEHWRNNVGCTDCHTPHGPNHGDMKADSITFIGEVAKQKTNEATTFMLKASEQQLCISCHNEVKSQFSKPFHHKVLEGTMKCSDCHNPHGGFESKQTKLSVGNDIGCVKCHSDKQGPFVFEHAPLKLEGCSACHTPHGASNAKLLKRTQVRQLCLECHSGITDQLADGPTGGPHSQLNIRSQNCTNCHSQIHGSNVSPTFFR